MADRLEATAKATGLDSGAIYYEVSPYIILFLRFYNVLVVIMAIISVVFCIVKGSDHQTYYLLASNVVLSCLIDIVVNWWYRGGDLSSDKYWFIFLLGGIILLQCVTTDIVVFHVFPGPSHDIVTSKTIRTTPHGIITWATLNSSTMRPPTTQKWSPFDLLP